ncbi:MAG: cache domain-containing sensor histidine kinase [Acetivibrionales bacterium]
MSFIDKKFVRRKSSLKMELISYNLLLIIIPLIITSLVSYRVYKKSMLQEVSEYSLKIINQLSSNIDMYLEDMVSISILTMYDKELQNILKKDDETYYIDEKYANLYREDKLKNFLFMLNNLRTEIDAVFIYGNDGHVYHNIKGRGIIGASGYNSEYDYKKSDWYKRAKQADGKSIIIETHKQEQILGEVNEVFSVAKIIKDINYGNEIGTILIDVNLTNIERICRNVIYSESEQIIIFDGHGNIVFSTVQNVRGSLARQIFDRIRDNEFGSYLEYFLDKEHLVTYTTSNYSSWKVVRFVPATHLLSALQFIKRLTFAVILLFMVFAAVLLFVISSKITSPVYKLREQMKLVEKGELNASVDVVSNNEIGQLSDSFNRMVRRLRDLVHRVYEVQLQKKEAQLIALQSQINPHFLYNTLDSIHMMAEMNNDFEVSRMVTTLAKLLRYSISSGSDFVKIADELDHVRNYIAIQQIRYENKFKFFSEVNEECKEYSTLKLTFQPLVENCIYHGFKNKKGKGFILLSIEKVNESLLIKIIDNGIGMTEERLAHVRGMLGKYDKSLDHKSIGISNVNNRIKNSFGEKYGIEVYSNQGIGTEVHLLIPAVIKNGEVGIQ